MRARAPLPSRRISVSIVLITTGYVALSELGHLLTFAPDSVPAFWPALGFAIALLARRSVSRLPLYAGALLLATLGDSLLRFHSAGFAVAFAVAATIGPVTGALLWRWRVRPGTFYGATRWVLDGLLPVALIPPLAGAIALTAAETALGDPTAGVWATGWKWFAAGALGVLVALPATMALPTDSTLRATVWPDRAGMLRIAEVIVLLGGQITLTIVVFADDPFGSRGWNWPLLLLPGMCWAVLRFGPRVTALLTAALTTIVVYATAHGTGPFSGVTGLNGRLLATQSLCTVVVVCALLMVHTIASRQLIEAALRRRTDAMEHAVEGIAFLDPDGHYLEVNRSYAAVLGTTPGALLGTSWEHTVHPRDISAVRQAIRTMQTTGSGSAEVSGVRADGSAFTQEITMVAERGRHTEREPFHCFVKDVTERHAALAQVDRLFVLSSDLLCICGGDGYFRRLNPAWERILGHEVDDLLTRPYLDYVHPDDVAATRAQFTASGTSRGSFSFENRYRCADGSYRWLFWKAAVDPVTGLVYAVASDITQRKETEGALATARDEAIVASRLKSEFLATMSHEIRTPMNGVMGLTELLGDTALDETQRMYVGGIGTAGTALMTVINDILDFSKIEAGKFVLEDVDFDPAAVVTDVVTVLTHQAGSKHLTLRSEIGPTVPGAVRGDPGRLRQILLNLAGNAVKFTPTGGVVVRVTAEPGTDRPILRFAVIDTGIGIAPEASDRLFEPFRQADASTTRVFGGTGLGLAISRQLAEAMGGDLVVTSAPDAGSTFTLTVTLGTADGTRRTAPGGPAGTTGSVGPLRVLVVDGDARRHDLDAKLRKWRFQPTVAVSGAAAISLLRTSALRGERFDIALVAARLPDMAGTTFATTIADHPAIPDLPVLLVCAAEAVEGGLPAAVAGRLALPVDRRALADALAGLPTTGSRQPPARRPVVTGGRILVVEDNEINQTVAVGLLRRLGYVADVAIDGLEALDRAEAGSYDAILMDCQMPLMDGYAASEALRSRPSTAQVPIIAMTASVQKEDRDRCLLSGMDDYLTKPIRPHDLEASLRRWVGRTGGRGAGAPRAEVDLPVAPAEARPAVTGHPAAGPIAGRLQELLGDRSPDEVALVEQIGASFLERAAGLYDGLAEALDAQNRVDAEQRAHAFRGAASNLGAERVAAVCAEIENGLRAGDAVDAAGGLFRLRTELDGAVSELRAGLDALVGSRG